MVKVHILLSNLTHILTKRFRGFYYNRSYFSHASHDDKELSFDEARSWFLKFKSSSIPEKIAKTTFSRSSGPGGQKTNKTSSKATTVWPINSLLQYIPKALHTDLRKSRYFVLSSQSISIQCDTHRSQSSNKAETHERLFQEIVDLYRKTVPGVTSPEKKSKIEQLKRVRNSLRIRMKMQHSAKKNQRKCPSSGN